MNSFYGPDISTVHHAQFRFRHSRAGSLDVKDDPRCLRPIAENVDEIMKIF